MKHRSEIRLSELIAYAQIYDLDITAQDITELKKLYDAHKGHIAQCVYKTFSQNIGITINFAGYYRDDEPRIVVEELAANTKTPMFRIGNYYSLVIELDEIPSKQDIWYIEQYASLLDNYNRTTFHFATVADLKQHILCNTFEAINFRSEKLTPTHISIFYWAADKLKDYNAKLFKPTKNFLEDLPAYCTYIADVLEFNNTRIAFGINRVTSYYRTTDFTLAFYIVTVGHDAYNWTDAGRYYAEAENWHSPGRIYFTDTTPLLPANPAVIESATRGKKFTLLDNQTLDILQRRALRKEAEYKRRDEANKVLTQRMATKIAALDSGATFVFNDMTFSANQIEYQGQILSDTHLKISEFLKRFSGNYSENNLNFDRVFATFIDLVVSHCAGKKSTSGTIGTVNYKVEVTTSKSGSTLWYINDQRINKGELADTLQRGLCYTQQADFDKFLESISACSLRMHRYLASGVSIHVRDEVLDTNVVFKLPLIRRKSSNFISLAGKEFKVSDTNRLLNIERSAKMSEVIGTLLNPNVLGLDGTQIKFIIEEGKKFYEESKALEQKLRDDTFKMFDIVQDTFNMHDGRSISGYLVKGKRREYVIEDNTLAVFENPTGHYICMVDKTNNEFNGTAMLINRIYALANDAMLSKEIHTLDF